MRSPYPNGQASPGPHLWHPYQGTHQYTEDRRIVLSYWDCMTPICCPLQGTTGPSINRGDSHILSYVFTLTLPLLYWNPSKIVLECLSRYLRHEPHWNPKVRDHFSPNLASSRWLEEEEKNYLNVSISISIIIHTYIPAHLSTHFCDKTILQQENINFN